MKTQTFDTILTMLEQDPLTERQKSLICGEQYDGLLTAKQAAEMIGCTTATLFSYAIPRIKINRRIIKYKRNDILQYLRAKQE